MSKSVSRYKLLLWVFFLAVGCAFAQSPIAGKISGPDGNPLPGATVVIVGANSFATTDIDGHFTLAAKPGDLIQVSFVGYEDYQLVLGNETELNINLKESTVLLNEVVVVGYGTQTRKDLTGAIATVQEKDFNKGNFASPDQLIQGRVAGVQITNNSGQPGVAATIKIRGNSVVSGTGQPLFVVDGVPLSGTSARPNIYDPFFGNTSSPIGNPLNFLNPSDIASIDVLKDASATAIYGSRAAYGVVIITTKKGQTGDPKLDFSVSTGLSSTQNKVKILNADQYRDAIEYYGTEPSNDKGGNSDALGAILRTGKQQNYSMAISGGGAVGKYRLSLGYFDQEGVIEDSELKKYNASLTSNFKFLDSKRLGIDVNIIASQYQEDIPLIRNETTVVGDALAWNPTDSLLKEDGSLNITREISNPLAVTELYSDNSKVTTIFASLAPYYEFTDWLTLKVLVSTNYGTGVRRNSVKQGLFLGPEEYGSAYINNNENTANQITNTLTFRKDIFPLLNVTAIAGFEYLNFKSKNSSIGVTGPTPGGFGDFGLDYTNYIQFSNPGNRNVSSLASPSTELQSYFARAVISYKSKYLVTGTFRADGSTKFGDDNKYGYFPSFAASWIVSSEEFMSAGFVNFLKLRAGWGKTGNQEFPSGSSRTLYGFTNNGGIGQINNPNPDLKWQSDEQFNIGVDFSLLGNKISGTLDFFSKLTTDLLYPTPPIQPAPPGSVVTWKNLDGKIKNTGLEATINATIINDGRFAWDVGLNVSFIKNEVSGLKSSIATGALHGGGMSGVTVQVIQNGVPLNTFYTRKYLGISESTGFSQYTDNGNTFYNVGNPNPTTVLGINSTFRVQKFSISTYLYGAFGHSIYNNTLNSTLNVAGVDSRRNIALSVYENPVKESLANPVTASSRYVERGDYLRMGNATLRYDIGSIGKAFKQASVYLTGQNLFCITQYSGFNPEVNIDKNVNSVPSLGIDYQAYPAATTVLVGLNFSL